MAVAGLFLLFVGVQDIKADDKLTVDGQIRLRDEIDLKSNDIERHSKVFHDLRTRVGLKFEPTDQTLVYVQLQDSRRLGDPSSGDLGTSENVDLHQAYFEIRNIIKPCLRFKAGRFELNYGNQRVFGSVGWSNTGRSWEGGILSCVCDKGRLDLFSLKKYERNDEDYNRDFDIIGFYMTINKIHLDLFAFYELDADTNGYVQEKLKRYNVGFYFNRDYHAFDFTLQGNYQFGEMPLDTLPDTRIREFSAFMAAAEIGYSFNMPAPARVAAGVDYTSGDEHPNPGQYEAYTNAYYTGHKFRGYMDYFISSPDYGLVDIMFRSKVEPAKRWSARLDFHYFRAAAYYKGYPARRPYSDIRTHEIGSEIDLTIENKSIKGVNLTGGFSLFYPIDYWLFRGTGRTGVWTYLMTTVNF